MADRNPGLLDSEEDLQAWLARMVSPKEPQKAGYEHTFAPGVQARINAEVQPEGGRMPQTITPTIGASLGPLSLDGGVQLQQAINEQGNPYTQVTPTIGAGMKVPLLGGEAALKARYTPEQLKLLEAEWKKKLLGGDVSLYGNYAQPAGDAPPAWGVGIRGSFPFRGGLR